MTLKNQEIKDFWTKTIPSYALIIVWFMFLIFSYYQSKNSDKVNIDISTTWDITTGTSTTWFDVTTGVVVEINTWEINSWTLLPPEWIREYLDYVLQNWIAGIDYISVEPPRPPIIRSDDKQVNNQVMFSYLDRTKITFTIPNNQKKWYVLFITNKEVSDSRDIFLAINSISKWAIRKNKSLAVSDINEYLYALNHITMAGTDWKWINAYNYVINNQLQLNAFVWEQWNYIKKIIIFFK